MCVFTPPTTATFDFLHSMCPAAVLGGDLCCIPSQDEGIQDGWGSLPHSQPFHPSPAPPATIPTGGTYFPCLVCTGIAGGEQLSTCKTSSEPSHVLNTDPQIPAELVGDAGREMCCELRAVCYGGGSWSSLQCFLFEGKRASKEFGEGGGFMCTNRSALGRALTPWNPPSDAPRLKPSP